MKNHSEMFQAIKTGTELQGAAEYIAKTEQGYVAKIAGLWQKVGEAVAENGSIQAANALLDELKAFYPANRLGEKAASIAKAASARGMKIHYYQLIAGRGNPSAFHAEPKPLTATQEAAQLQKVIKICEKDAKKAEKEGDKEMAAVCAEMAAELAAELEQVAPAAELEAAEKVAAAKVAKLQAIYDDLMADILTIAELEQVILAATADKLAAQIADDQDAQLAA